MSGMETRDGKINVADLWHMLQDLEDGTIAPVQRDELMNLLDRSPAARRAYFEYFEQAAILSVEGAKQFEQGILPVLEESRGDRKLFRRSVLAAAAVLVLAAFLAALIAVRQPKPGLLTAKVAADTRWMVDGEVQSPGSDELTVAEGATVHVFSGTVKLRLESGTLMVMQGPALASLSELNRPVLTNVWLWIDSG